VDLLSTSDIGLKRGVSCAVEKKTLGKPRAGTLQWTSRGVCGVLLLFQQAGNTGRAPLTVGATCCSFVGR
jgi:hypothetical protein